MKNITKKDILLVFGIFGLAYILRVIFLSDLSLTFGYDQARDALVTQQILSGDIKILGPPASTPGLFHGVFYYYFLAPAYFLGKSPIIAAYWNSIFNASVVFISFYLTYLLTKSKKAGFIAAFLYAISFEATQYSTWLSNPTIGIWTVPLIYLGLWLWLKEGKRWGSVIAALGLGLSIQADIFLLYHCIPVLFWILVKRRFAKKVDIVKFAIVLLVSLSTMILVEFKFGFKGISGLQQIALSQEASLAYAKSLGDYLTLYLNQIGRIYAFNSYPGNIGYGGFFVLLLIYLGVKSAKNSKDLMSWGSFLAIWLLSHIAVVTVGGTSTPFLMVGIGPAVSILIAVFASKVWENGHKWVTLGVLTILLFGNISMIMKENPKGSTLFAIQKDMLLAKQLKLVDYTYDQAEGDNFSINSLTSPLWINIVWTYLYEWYGQEKYGYLPQWHGRDQVGQLASLSDVELETDKYYLVIEPMGGIPTRYLGETESQENSVSELVDEVSFGELRVQKRTKL